MCMFVLLFFALYSYVFYSFALNNFHSNDKLFRYFDEHCISGTDVFDEHWKNLTHSMIIRYFTNYLFFFSDMAASLLTAETRGKNTLLN